MATAKKYLTERQAWLKLAKMWDKAQPATGGLHAGNYYVDFGKSLYAFGLCCSTLYLRLSNMIVKEMEDQMDGRLRDEKATANVSGYVWPLSKKGAVARASFCRKMAEKCKPAKRKVAK